jgi:hypothetical protein
MDGMGCMIEGITRTQECNNIPEREVGGANRKKAPLKSGDMLPYNK